MSGHIRHRLWLRLLLGVAAIALYAVVALVLAAVIPRARLAGHRRRRVLLRTGDRRPGPERLRARRHPSRRVRAHRPSAVRIVATVLVAITAAAAGPVLAVLGRAARCPACSRLAQIALAAAGVVIGATRVWVTRRLTSPSWCAPPRAR
jgi:hypothetical protein